MSMTRRSFLGLSAAGLAAAAYGRLLDGAKPNFIIIYTDDQGYNDLGCFGSPLINTPNIDRMASEGMKFTDFYAPSCVCSPSRAGLLTGCHPQRIGFNFGALWPGDNRGLNPSEITIAEQLKGQGYATACIGKWHVGCWDSRLMPTNHGFDYFFGMGASNDYPGENTALYENLAKVDDIPDQTALTQRYTQKALDFMTQNQAGPFFLYLCPNMPHLPLAASADFLGKSGRGLYGDAVEELDWSVGQVLQKVRDLGLDNNTCVVFTSDNGPWLEKSDGTNADNMSATDGAGSAWPLLGGKFGFNDGAQREPCVMRWPGAIPAGSVCPQAASGMDFFVTFSKLAGASIPTDRVIDGKDIFPLMAGTPGAVSPYDEDGFFFDHVNFKPVRRGQWKYFNIWGDDCLYDMTVPLDQIERANLARTYPAVCAELKALAEARWLDMAVTNFRAIGNINEMVVERRPRFDPAKTIGGADIGSEFFTIDGRRVRRTHSGAVPPGIYFQRTGNGPLKKVVVR